MARPAPRRAEFDAAMTWEELVAEFRALGGIVDNARLGTGSFGRGIFAIDPVKPAKIHAPPNLIVPVDRLEVRDHQLRVKADWGNERERAFLDDYQQFFGWGAGLFEEVWREQEAWYTLPAQVKDYIINMGGSQNPGVRFLEPSTDTCFFHYILAREFNYEGSQHLVPMVDLVNHSPREQGYVIEEGLGVEGTFENEVFVRYNIFDTWGHALTYGFTDLCYFAYSLAITVELFGTHKVSIFRDADESNIIDGVRYPKITTVGRTITLPNLMLGNIAAADTPRAVFRKLMQPAFTQTQADDTFESMQQFNRGKFIGLLRLLRGEHGKLVRMLEDAAINQLDTLSACVGARAL